MEYQLGYATDTSAALQLTTPTLGPAEETDIALPLVAQYAPVYGLTSSTSLSRPILAENTYWVDWVNSKLNRFPDMTPANQIFVNENRARIEGSGGYVNTSLPMPFILLNCAEWMMGIHVNKCQEAETMHMLIQDYAETRNQHKTSYDTFTSRASQVVTEFGRVLREDRTVRSPSFSHAELLAGPERVKIEDGRSLGNDVWAVSFSFPVVPRR